MILDHSNYRSYLKATLAERIGHNPAYSLRAMAGSLGLSPAGLSRILNGQKNLSPERALQIAEKLNLKANEREYFCTLVQYDSAKTPELKSSFHAKLNQLNKQSPIKDLSIDIFKVISEWYYIPILEMTEILGYELTAKSAAKRLGISIYEAADAIERLQRLELLEKNKDDLYVKTHDTGVFNSKIPNSAFRKFHRKMLEKAIEAIEGQTLNERHISSYTFSFDSSQLDEARLRIENFQKDFVKFSSSRRKRTQIYQMNVQLFNLTKEKPNETKK